MPVGVRQDRFDSRLFWGPVAMCYVRAGFPTGAAVHGLAEIPAPSE